ncbi:hypothetical protein KY285_010288 [Solanum tuberosum]|nr:hypothetical protein KY289_010829 [Solanum tuberosum]KAH0734581.1 hypothetical protein KY285_010288 [Solanum tuberosum]
MVSEQRHRDSISSCILISQLDHTAYASVMPDLISFVTTDLTVATLEHFHSFYLHASDTPGASLIAIKLRGPTNYGLWSRSLRLALLVKKKLCFINGTCLKSSYKGDLVTQWERCNDVVLSWIRSTVAQKYSP